MPGSPTSSIHRTQEVFPSRSQSSISDNPSNWSPNQSTSAPHIDPAILFQDLAQQPVSQLAVSTPVPGLSTSTNPDSQPIPPIPGDFSNLQLPPTFGVLIAEAIKSSPVQCLPQLSATSSAGVQTHHSFHRPDLSVSEQGGQHSPDQSEHDSIFEEGIPPVDALSEDEGLDIDQPPFVGLFKPQLFKSLLYKAQVSTGLGDVSSSKNRFPTGEGPSGSPSEPSTSNDMVPAPKLFTEVVQRQWVVPGSGPFPNTIDKRLYHMAPEMSSLLQVPTVDAPVVALASSTHFTGPPEESLRPEVKRAEKVLVKGHQAVAWSVKAAASASFFNRATIIWLKQLQARTPSADIRSHQDLNKTSRTGIFRRCHTQCDQICV
ncbi:uncharacterized protein LOC131189195 [Ahaetulla prasina]|uniref:uncharacterized protein LOC131189195 n=1 Tax=Ahaetulla prasina TaxID=499056 RepID=UPI002647671E|nr:uncharacterized protein LOC131189195 [Ahaetulla prasina]